MKRLNRISTGSWNRVMELWREGQVTDVIMTRDTIAVYHLEELVHGERIGEEEIHSFVDETIPADHEQLWREEIRKGKLFKYSFLLSEEIVVRCLLWNFGLSLRFIPAGELSEKYAGKEVISLVESLPFMVVHSGKRRSGKTTRIVGQVRKLLKNPDMKVFVYSDPQEVYTEGKGVLIYISRKNMSFDDFLDLAFLSSADAVVVQGVKLQEEVNKLFSLFSNGVSVIAEIGYYDLDIPYIDRTYKVISERIGEVYIRRKQLVTA